MESGLLNDGVRQKDGPRFTTVDPLWEKCPSLSPYAYSANNPLRFTDPSGKQFTFYKAEPVRDEWGHIQAWIIDKTQVDNQLKERLDQVIAALEAAGVEQVEQLKYLRDSKDFVINLVDVPIGRDMKFFEFYEGGNPNEQFVLSWSSGSGMQYKPWKDASSSDYEFESPAVMLVHESSHPYRRFTNEKQYRADMDPTTGYDPNYDNIEERKATMDEFAAGQKLGQLKNIRPDHSAQSIVAYPMVCNPMQNVFCFPGWDEEGK